MNWRNALTDQLAVAYPIVQAPMLGVTTPEMVAAISNAGGLGSLPVGGLSPQVTTELIRKTRQLTTRPFAVNLFAHAIPAVDYAVAEAMQAYLEQLCQAHQISFQKVDLDSLRFYSYTEQIDVLIEEKIPVVSFTFGIINDASMDRLKRAGATLVGNATCVREAQLIAEKDIDLITVQGIEAGGHRGSFMPERELPMVGLLALLPQVADCVRKPLLAAGGIHDGRTIRAALALGASGVQIGTAFIASPESNAIPAYKERLAASADTDTRLTRSFSGRWARGIANTFMQAVETSGLMIPEYPIQNSLTTALRAAAQRQNNPELTNLWAGQSASRARGQSAAAIFRELVTQTEALA